jgi:pyruvate/2-oxoglutarate dehydrogenase complex dihydrolipoamide acyltransferase (E2) component
MSKQGSTLAGVMDAFSVAISIGLQYGVPLETFVGKFTNMRFEPAGMTDDPDIRMAASVMDYIFRRLALDFLPYDTRAELGIFTAKERAAQIQAEAEAASVDLAGMAQSAPVSAPVGAAAAPQADAPKAPEALPGPGTSTSARRPSCSRWCWDSPRMRRSASPAVRRCARRQLLRMRGLRFHVRLQLTTKARPQVAHQSAAAQDVR